MPADGSHDNDIASRALLLALLLTALGAAAHVYLHFAPGALSPDSLNILRQAREGVYEDGHPPLMSAVWGLLDRAIPGPTGMLLLHLALFYGGLLLIFHEASRQHGLLAVPVLLVAGLYPPVIGILGAIWSDITMAALFLFAVGCWLHRAEPAPGRAMLLLILLLLALGVAVRHNAAAAAFPLLTLLFLRQRGSGVPMFRTALFAVFAGALATVLLFAATKWISARFVEQPRHLWRAAALYDIAGASYYEGRNLFHPGVLSSSSMEEIRRLYSPRSYIPLVSGEQIHPHPGATGTRGAPLELATDNPRLNELVLRNWRSVVLDHPRAYLRHRLEFFRSMVQREPWGLWAPIFDMIYPNQLGVPERATVDSWVFAQVRSLSARSVLFEPLPHLVLSALMFLPILVLGVLLRDRVLQAAGALYASGVLHMVGLFFFAVTPDFRYSHWLFAATAVASGLVILVLTRFSGMALTRCVQAVQAIGDRMMGQ